MMEMMTPEADMMMMAPANQKYSMRNQMTTDTTWKM